MKASNSGNITGRASKLLWKIQHGGSLGMVSMEELENKRLIEESKLRYTNDEARGDKLRLLFQILGNRGRKKHERKN